MCGGMWNKSLLALALSAHTVACVTCTTPPGLAWSSQSSGSASQAFDSSALAANPQLGALDQGLLDVAAFGVISLAELGPGYTTFRGDIPGPHDALRGPNGDDDVLVWFRLSDASVLSCQTTLTKLSAPTSALSDLCSAAGLSLGAAGQPAAEVYIVSLSETAQGAESTSASNTLAMSGYFIAYVDLRSVAGTVTSSVALDAEGHGTVSVTIDFAPTTVTTWYTGTASGVTTPGVGTVQLGAAHLTGVETLTTPPQDCSSGGGSSGGFGSNWQT
jgi:hypothetical protein